MIRPGADALLVFPPWAYSMIRMGGIHPAVHFLANSLEEDGFEAHTWDLNRDCLGYLLDERTLRPVLEVHQKTLRRLERRQRLSRQETSAYYAALVLERRLSLAIPHLALLREPAKLAALKVGDTDYGELLLPATSHYLELEFVKPPLNVSTLAREMRRDKCRRFRRLIRPAVRLRLARSRPALVGLSVPFACQMLPALLIAAEIRAHSPATPICVGGPLTSLLPERSIRAVIELGVVDYVVKGEGEVPLARLVRQTTTERAETLTQTWFRDRGGRAAFAGESAPPPRPGRVGRFRVPIPEWHRSVHFVPVLQSRGCYWHKCHFCDYVNLYCRSVYQPRPAAAVADDISFYVRRHGKRSFALIADAIPPRHCRQIAEELLRRGLRVSWKVFIRVDGGFDAETIRAMALSGCAPDLGLESSETRILAIINKGYSHEQAQEFFETCRKASLVLEQVNVILDVPTTRYEEALAVYEFCRGYADLTRHVAVFRFELTATSVMGRDPQRFGIVVERADARRAGRLGALAFRDPHGMSEAQKRSVERLYAELNGRLLHGRRPGPWPSVGAGAAGTAWPAGSRYVFPSRAEMIECAVLFSPTGRRYARGPQVTLFRPASVVPGSSGGASPVSCVAEVREILFGLAGRAMTVDEFAAVIGQRYTIGTGAKRVASALLDGLIATGLVTPTIAEDQSFPEP